MKSMFSYCSSLTSIPLLNISNVSNLDLIFTASYFLTKIDKVRFFYQQDKLLLKALSNNLDFFTTDKLNNLLSKYEQSFIFT
jgi:surface protein